MLRNLANQRFPVAFRHAVFGFDRLARVDPGLEMAFLRGFSVLVANSLVHLGVHGVLTFGVERKLLRPKVMIQELLHRCKYCITQNWPLGTALFAVSTSRQTIRKWIQHALAEDPPRAKSLVVTIFGDATNRTVAQFGSRDLLTCSPRLASTIV